MEFEITVKGRKRLASRGRVIEALQGVDPERETMYMVEIEGATYPVKQAFCVAFGLDRGDATTRTSCRVLERLGFVLITDGIRPPKPRVKGPSPASYNPPWSPRHGKQDWLEPDELVIPPIVLNWWFMEAWEDLAGLGEHADEVDMPPAAPGVYEVYRTGDPVPAYIGQSANLYKRVVGGLVRGIELHTAGQKVRESEDPADLTVRWALTDRPAAAEEELYRRNHELWGRLPAYAGRR